MVFGVGATSDSNTLVAVAARELNERWLNLGIRGASSTQEVQAFLPFAFRTRRLVICSGVNNLIIALQTDDGTRDVFHPVYYDKAFDIISEIPLVDVATLVKNRQSFRAVLQRVASAGTTKSEKVPGSPQPVQRDMWNKMRKAAERQLRDLEISIRLVGSANLVTFCVQPFAQKRNRLNVEEERSLIGIYDVRQGAIWQAASNFAEARWSDYVDLLRKGCASRGVRFINLTAEEFDGWAFLDRVHLTDLGYRQAAQRVCQEIE